MERYRKYSPPKITDKGLVGTLIDIVNRLERLEKC